MHSLQISKSWFPTYRPDGPEEASGPHQCSKNVQTPQETPQQCIDDQTAQQTASPESTYLHRFPNSKLVAANSEHCKQPSGC